MESMTMTCVCTEEVSSIVLIPSTGNIVFNTTTTTVLDNGTEVGTESTSTTVALPDALLAEVMALNITKDPRMAR
jgi:hypothetical protein